jgi:hypothetical protein
MGTDYEIAKAALRVSLSTMTTAQDLAPLLAYLSNPAHIPHSATAREGSPAVRTTNTTPPH